MNTLPQEHPTYSDGFHWFTVSHLQQVYLTYFNSALGTGLSKYKVFVNPSLYKPVMLLKITSR